MKRTQTPLQRTTGELADLVRSIRSDCAQTAAKLLRANEPDAAAIEDLARLDEALCKATESVANVCSMLLVRELLRNVKPRTPRFPGS